MNKLVAQTMAKKENGEKGFTLIELLVVVIIIGILAAIAIPVFLNMREGAWKSSVETDVANAVLVVEQATQASNGSVDDALAADDSDLTADADDSAYAVAGKKGNVSEGNSLEITKGTTAGSYTITASNKDYGDTKEYVFDSSSGKSAWATE